MAGQVIGINSAIFSPSGGNIGIGFAIPAAIAKPVVEQLKQFGRTHRGWLGVKIQEVSEEVADSVGLPSTQGALVLEVSPGSPAAKVGIQTGDVITQYGGKDVTEMRFLPRMVAETPVNTAVPVTVWRKGKSQQYQITVGELDEDEDEKSSNTKDKSQKNDKRGGNAQKLLGMYLAPITPALKNEFRLDGKTQGVVVVEVESGSEADKRGFNEGDVIEEVNNTAVKSVVEIQNLLAEAKKAGRKYALVKVLREKESAFVTVPVDEVKKP
jgi:serine protease Do